MVITKSTGSAILKLQRQYLIYLILSLVVSILTWITHEMNPQILHRFTGRISPFSATLVLLLAGFTSLSYLTSKTSILIHQRNNYKGIYIAAGLASIFGTMVIIADLFLLYPEDINAEFPVSIPFYPAIGFFAEILFHLFPFTIFVFFLSGFRKKVTNECVILCGIAAVSFIEPFYQLTAMGGNGRYSPALLIHTGVNVFLISILQLIIFKKYDFISMYVFRLVYYLIWHIIWGHFRLQILF